MTCKPVACTQPVENTFLGGSAPLGSLALTGGTISVTLTLLALLLHGHLVLRLFVLLFFALVLPRFPAIVTKIAGWIKKDGNIH